MSDPDAARERGQRAGRLARGNPERSTAPSERLPQQARLRKRSEFLQVQSEGSRVHTPHFVLLVLPRAEGVGQALGVTATRKLGGAVQRNRIKRLLREVFRRNRQLFPADCEVVAVARAGAARLDYAAVRAEIAEAQSGLERASRHRQAAPAVAPNAPTRSRKRSSPSRKPPPSSPPRSSR